MKNNTSKKVYIVTGGNSGIGYEICVALAQQSAHVVLVSRTPERGQTAQKSIQDLVPHAKVDLVIGDVGSIASTKKLAQTLLDGYPTIDALINNAGVWMTKKQLNEDGLEFSFMINHLAPFMLNQLLQERLIASAPSRIVCVNAGLYVKGKVDLEQTPYGHDFGRIRTYASSKLCNVLTLKQQASQLEGSGVTINMVHPGVIQSSLGDSKGIMGWLLRQVKKRWSTAEEGAEAPVWLATAPELAQTSGGYFDEKRQIPLDEVAQNEALADAIWRLSAQLSGIGSSSRL